MTKKYFDILEVLDSKLADIIDQLEDELQVQEYDEDKEVCRDFIDSVEEIRGVIND